MKQNFLHNISYLKKGNKKQKKAYQVLKELKIYQVLEKYNPMLVGTIPLGIDIAGSDLDIICEVHNLQEFGNIVLDNYKGMKEFNFKKEKVRGIKTFFASFKYNKMPVEIFGQPKPVNEQNAYRHMLVEKYLLDLGGKEIKEEIIKLKTNGFNTEEAFAEYLNLKGNPFTELYQLSRLSKDKLKQKVDI